MGGERFDHFLYELEIKEIGYYLSILLISVIFGLMRFIAEIYCISVIVKYK